MSSRRLVVSLLAAVGFSGVGSPAPAGAQTKSKLIREPGATYLEDFLPSAMKFPLKNGASIFYDIQLNRYLGDLRPGQQIELIALGPKVIRVRGKAQQGQVLGWIPESTITFGPGFVENLLKAAERHRMVSEMIARNDVAVGMTMDEVTKSLGKPQRKSSRADATSREDIWEFVRYETVPQQQPGYDRFGRYVNVTTYVKIPVGTMSVTFREGVVSALAQSEGTPPGGAGVRIVVPPIEVY